ncbi:MAG: hypothetical protein IPH45_12675 [Bacteroidales bacterium]|nr:hypothetical protein [Bacteroidales bacterium]
MTEEIVNINHLCNELHNQFSELLENRQISLIVDTKSIPDNLNILTDKNRLRQVLCNLLDNAMKFTSEGMIHFGCKMDHEFLEFYVKDSGIGIAPENHNMVFKPFRQVETTDIRNYMGNGLGLSISKALVEKMGGNMFFTSALGQGSSFRFRIPCRIPQKSTWEPTEGKSVSKDKNWNKHIVLVVEDEVYNYSYLEA